MMVILITQIMSNVPLDDGDEPNAALLDERKDLLSRMSHC